MRAHTEPKFLCNCLLNKNNNKVFLVHELLQYEQRGLVPSWFMGHQACFSWLCQNVAVLSPCHQAVNDSSRLCKVKSTVIRRAGYPAVWQHAGCLSCKINNPQDLRISVDLWAFFSSALLCALGGNTLCSDDYRIQPSNQLVAQREP